MTDVLQAPRQSDTGRTTAGGGRSIQSGAGEMGYGLGSHTSLAGPSSSNAAVAAQTFGPGSGYFSAGSEPLRLTPFLPGKDSYTVAGTHIDPSLANPYLPPASAPAPPPSQSAHDDFGGFAIDPALLAPSLNHPAFGFLAPAVDTPPYQPESDPFLPPYQWYTPSYRDVLDSPAHSPSPAGQFMYPDPDIATDSYVANWVAASLDLPLEPEREGVFAQPVPVVVEPVVVAGPKKRARKSRAKGKGPAAEPFGPPTTAMGIPISAMEMMGIMAPVPTPAPIVLGPSPSQALAALQSAASSKPGVPVPAAYRHVWFLNGRGRVSKTRDNNPRCQRCRRRHWAVSIPSFLAPLPLFHDCICNFGPPVSLADFGGRNLLWVSYFTFHHRCRREANREQSCSRGQPCDECAKDGVPCVYGPGLGPEEE